MNIGVFASVTLPAPTIRIAPKGRCSCIRLISIVFLVKNHTFKTNLISADYQKKSVWMTKHCLPPHLTAIFMLMSSLLAEQCVKLRATRHHGQREDRHICTQSLSHREKGQVADIDVILKAPSPLLPFFFFFLCKRCLSSRNPDTAHRDQSVAFFSGFLQGCCMGFDSIMQIA